jgi:FtsP/CotA-like multicopper oxidase with cupredoxin domain
MHEARSRTRRPPATDFVADQPGLTLFHCHIQHHMDYGFKALFRYA